MRRPFGILALALAVVLVAATPTPAPQPSPVVTPAVPTPQPVLLSQQPTVAIYPFDVQSGTDPKIGAAIAQILAQEMTTTGGITVLPIPAGVARPQFQDYAKDHHADFYISGYVTPVGDYASVVSQVVSVDSGVILFSLTAQVNSVADVASQALQERASILAIAGRGTQNINAQSASTPAPTATNGAAMQIKGIPAIVDSVFGHHHNAGATPAPAPAAKPPRGVIVAAATASGAVPGPDLSNATNELYFAMQRTYNASLTTVTGSIKKNADTICGTNRDNTIATGLLGINPGKHPSYTFTLQVYTCFGILLDGEIGKGPTIKSAVDAAVTAYAKAHPDNS